MPKTRTSYRPGQSGNPAGAARRGESVAEAIRTYMAGSDGKRKRADVLAETLYSRVTEADVAAARLLLAYCDGLPVQRTETAISTSPSNGPAWVELRTQLLAVAAAHPEIDAVLAGMLNGDSAN